MFKQNDPFSFQKFCSLINNTTKIGAIITEFQVRQYNDVQLSGINALEKKHTRKYLVQCRQRINIFNPNGISVKPNNKLGSYDDYPAMIQTNMNIKQELDEGPSCQLLDYSPQTVNTKIQSSGTSGEVDGKTTESSTSNTVGSSTSQTNSYGVSVSSGYSVTGNFFNPSGSITGSHEHSSSHGHSKTRTNDRSHTSSTGSSTTQSSDTSASESMSIKDWGSYALVDAQNKQTPTWTFGQEYPYDVIECRKTTGVQNPHNTNQVQLVIPTSMSVRLWDGTSLYPPSHLSMFGFNFIMKATWLVTIDNSTTGDITVLQNVDYFSASHYSPSSGGKVAIVYLDNEPTILKVGENESLSTELNLPLMALNPIGLNGRAAIIGFIPSKFIKLPSPAINGKKIPPSHFEIISSTNDLMILDTTDYPNPTDPGAGFTASETCLTAGFAANCTKLQMSLYFKVIDNSMNYWLYLKHWKTRTPGKITLTLIINKDTSNPIVKHVDAEEAEGGESNLLTIALRDLDYASVNYHDYLQLGLNSIDVVIESQSPSGTPPYSGYQIRAISIEKS